MTNKLFLYFLLLAFFLQSGCSDRLKTDEEKISSVKEMIDTYIQSIGLKKSEIYDSNKKAWRWKVGSATLDVFIQDVKTESGTRTYLRIFSGLMQIPERNQAEFYKSLLQMNDSSLGVKLTKMPDSDWIYATFERDIRGMDYSELATCIADMEYWVDKLDDELKTAFYSN
jgi:hypothetical protein